MSWSNRLMKKIDNRIDHSISMSNPIAGVRQTTIDGYRSLHLTEICRFGVGSKNSVDLTIYDTGDWDFFAT